MPWPAVPASEENTNGERYLASCNTGTYGELITHDFDKAEDIPVSHLQVGIDDCSTDLELRGAPVFRSLVGPMPEGKNIIRYETPEVFEMLTKEWAIPSPPKRRSRKKKTATNG